MTVDSTTTAVQAVPVDAMEEAEVHREERGGGGDGLWIIVGLIVVFGGVIGLAELTGIPLEKRKKD